jgi:hypothetical protein
VLYYFLGNYKPYVGFIRGVGLHEVTLSVAFRLKFFHNANFLSFLYSVNFFLFTIISFFKQIALWRIVLFLSIVIVSVITDVPL